MWRYATSYNCWLLVTCVVVKPFQSCPRERHFYSAVGFQLLFSTVSIRLQCSARWHTTTRSPPLKFQNTVPPTFTYVWPMGVQYRMTSGQRLHFFILNIFFRPFMMKRVNFCLNLFYLFYCYFCNSAVLVFTIGRNKETNRKKEKPRYLICAILNASSLKGTSLCFPIKCFLRNVVNDEFRKEDKEMRKRSTSLFATLWSGLF